MPMLTYKVSNAIDKVTANQEKSNIEEYQISIQLLSYGYQHFFSSTSRPPNRYGYMQSIIINKDFQNTR